MVSFRLNRAEFIRSVSARLLSSFVGSIMSMSPVVSSLASIMTRHCQISIAAAPDWKTEFDLD